MFCAKCGKEVNENEKVCPYCGEVMRPAVKPAKPEPVQTEEVQAEAVEPVGAEVVAPANDNPAKLFGIIGFCASFISGIVGIILSAIGLKKYKQQENKELKGLATAGLALSIVRTVFVVGGIGLYAVIMVFSFILGMIGAFA